MRHSVLKTEFLYAIPGIFLLLAFFYYPWTWTGELGDFGGDNAFYLLMARQFSPWSGPDAVSAYFTSQSLYPPLYPLMLALFGGAESLLAAHLITVTLLLLSFVVLYLWLRLLDVSALVTLILVLLVASLPGVLMEALSIHSESLYLLLTLCCLAAVASYEVTGRQVWLWAAAASLAAALLTRSAGVALVVAFGFYLILHRPPRFLMLMVVPLIPTALWQLIRQGAGSGYTAAFIEKYATSSLAAVVDQLVLEANVTWQSWVTAFTSSPVGAPVMAFVALLCLIGASHRVYQRKLDGFYAAAYLGLVLIWPYPAEVPRLLFVIIPVLLAQGFLFLHRVPRLAFGHVTLRAPLILAVAIALVVVPGLVLTAKRFFSSLPDELSGFRHAADWYVLDPDQALANVVDNRLLVDHIKHIPTLVPEEDCIYAIKPSVVGYYGRRISIIPPRSTLDERGFNQYLNEKGCRFFYLMGFASPTFPSFYYPLERLRGSLTILSVAATPGRENSPIGILARRSGQ